MPSNHFILCHPLLLPPSIFPSIRVFSNVSVVCIRWPKYWSFSFSISLCNEYSGLISFRIDWFDLLIVQGTLKSHFPPKYFIFQSVFPKNKDIHLYNHHIVVKMRKFNNYYLKHMFFRFFSMQLIAVLPPEIQSKIIQTLRSP